MIQTSEQINALALALAQAQGEMQNPPKNKEVEVRMKAGGTYKFNYTELNVLIDAIRKPFANHKIAHITQVNYDLNLKCPIVTVSLIHESGQWISSAVPVPSTGDMKADQGNITYVRRNLLGSLVGIAGEGDAEDEPSDGAEYRSIPKPSESPQTVIKPKLVPEATKPKNDAIAEAQARREAILHAVTKSRWTKEQASKFMIDHFGTNSMSEINDDQAAKIIEQIINNPQKDA